MSTHNLDKSHAIKEINRIANIIRDDIKRSKQKAIETEKKEYNNEIEKIKKDCHDEIATAQKQYNEFHLGGQYGQNMKNDMHELIKSHKRRAKNEIEKTNMLFQKKIQMKKSDAEQKAASDLRALEIETNLNILNELIMLFKSSVENEGQLNRKETKQQTVSLLEQARNSTINGNNSYEFKQACLGALREAVKLAISFKSSNDTKSFEDLNKTINYTSTFIGQPENNQAKTDLKNHAKDLHVKTVWTSFANSLISLANMTIKAFGFSNYKLSLFSSAEEKKYSRLLSNLAETEVNKSPAIKP